MPYFLILLFSYFSYFMIESIILGTIQGIAEWLPVSSEGLIFLVKTNFFNGGESLKEITALALWLHLGTFLAALIYFRIEVVNLIKTFFNYKSAAKETQKTLFFLIITTLISGFLGLILIYFLVYLENYISYTAKTITLIIGLLLLLTAFLQLKAKNKGLRKARDIEKQDGLVLGFVQGIAALPGVSRSGITVSTLLLKKFDETLALKLSFLMSLPIVLGGNIILNLDKLALNLESIVGLFASFIFGYLTIGILLKIAKKINFGWFVLGFGILTIFSVILT